MMAIICLGTAALLWLLAYSGAGRGWWLGAVVTMLTALALTPGTSPWLVTALAVAMAALMALAFVPALRRTWVAAPLLRRFRRVMPRVSPTELAALEAGSVWWDAEVFGGRPAWGRLQDLPKPRLSPLERAFMDGPVEALCRMLDDWAITHEEQDLPPEVWSFLRRQHFFGLIIPREHGGHGFSARAHSEIVMKLASRSITAAVTVMVPNSLGPAKLILHYGTLEQKRRYLPRLATGEEIPCFALTGPEAGSDASAIPDTGIVCRGEWQGREVLGVRIDWDKRYITLAPVATVIGLAFRLRDPDHLLGEQEDIGITVALIPRHLPGITIGRRHITLGIPFQNGPISGRGVFVPLEQIIGGRAGAGRGWTMLMECLAEGRGISLPALAVGAAKTASRYTGAYAAVRRQFGTPIGHFEGVEEILARIGGLTYQMDAARLLCLTGLDLGEKPAVISAIVKFHLTEGYRRIINDAMDIQGGSGICLGPGNLFGRAYQAIPIAITVEGANVLTRNMIIFGQGAIRCHPWVLEELAAVHDADKARGLARFDRALAGHVAFLLGNLARTLFLGLGDGRLSAAPRHPDTRRHYQRLNRISAAFALCADATMMTLGGTLKRRERLSARLGDVLSELVLASAVLKRFEDDGRPAADLPLVHWCCERGLYRMQEALRAQLGAIPVRPLGWLLRLLVFPTGCHYGPPDDHLDHEVARLLLTPSTTRDRLTAGIFTTTDPALRQGQLERALLQTQRTAALEKTLRDLRHNGVVTASDPGEQIRQARARGFITARECRELERMFRWRAEVVAVDHFEDYGHRWALTADGREPATTAAPHAA